MKQPTFFEGVLLALLLATAGSGIVYALDWLLPGGLIAYALLAGLGLSYVLYLQSRSDEKAGRIIVPMIFAAVSVACWLLSVPLWINLVIVTAAIWLVRVLYRYRSVVSALADLVLSAIGLSAGIATYLHTNSLFLSLWSFFLIQAVSVFIPVKLSAGRDVYGRQKPGTEQPSDRFEEALGTAESALRKLVSR